MNVKSLIMLVAGLLLLGAPVALAAPSPAPTVQGIALAALAAPQLTSPADGVLLSRVGPVTLQWEPPAGVTQYQLQVTPANGDGPGVNLIRNADREFTILAPPTWYVLLPDMTYSWRVRVTDKPSFAGENDPTWSPWSPVFQFRTPAPTTAGLRAVAPAEGGSVPAAAFDLRWSDASDEIFYYELQVSTDRQFRTSDDAVASVWWNLIHSGVTPLPRSWRTPDLQPATTYYWRVRPRVQGSGTPVAWGPTWMFSTGAMVLPPLPTPVPMPTVTPTPTPTPMPVLTNRIAFVSTRDGNSEIYTMNADGSNQKRLTTSEYDDSQPSWSPDGGTIAFLSNREDLRRLYLINADGSNDRRLVSRTTSILEMLYSRTHDRIGYILTDGIFSVGGDGASTAKHYGLQAEQLSWSPVTAAVAFVNFDAERSQREQRAVSDIIVINNMPATRTPNIQRITTVDAINQTPAWSPDATRIGFASDRASLTAGNHDIWVADPNGGNPRRLTTADKPDTAPAWSPDGKKIAFVSERDGLPQIYVMNADGSGQTRLTQTTATERKPQWFPDGSRILFESNRDGHLDLYAMDPDGKNPINLSKTTGGDSYGAAWSPK